jgi:hypothetical protein
LWGLDLNGFETDLGASFRSPPVRPRPNGDRQQPTGETIGVLERRQLAVRAQERLLRQVLDVGAPMRP